MNSHPNDPPMPHIQQAIQFLYEQRLGRVLTQASKVWQKRQLSGILHLPGCSIEEHVGIASLFNQPMKLTGSRHIALSDFDTLLRESDYHCGLEDIFRYLFPETCSRHDPLPYEQVIGTFQDHLLSQCKPGAWAYQWLREGDHGLPWIVRRYKKRILASETKRQEVFERLTILIKAIEALPAPDVNLAVWANDWYGNPHALDTTTEDGRLFYEALSDIWTLQDGDYAFISKDQREGGNTTRKAIYDLFGLRLTDLSSLVYVSGPLQISYPDHTLHLDDREVHPLSRATLRHWLQCEIRTNKLYIIENLTVFNELHRRCQPLSPRPTLICGGGWPSRAVHDFLGFIMQTQPTVQLLYNGDFDLEGLRICRAFSQWYPRHCHLWHMDEQAYLQAIPESAQPIALSDQIALQSLSERFQHLVNAMLRKNTYAYQEGLLPVLLEDIYKNLISEEMSAGQRET